MKLTKIESYEIQAFAFRVMTGYVAPGKDASPLADEAPYEERCAAFDEWRNEHAPCILAMLLGFEALIDRDDEPTRALLDRLDDLETNGAQAVRWAPSSAHWSNELKRLFGSDAREGVDNLERQLRDMTARLEAAERENERLRSESKAQLEELDRIDDALGTNEGPSAVDHIMILKTENERLRAVVSALAFQASRDPFVSVGHWCEHGPCAAIIRDISNPNADHHGPDWTERDSEYLK